MNQKNIRNFCIIAHIDHGKSTLADRFLELTNTVEKREMHEQYLDTMELEQERGITIKLQPVTMSYQLQSTNYKLNLIDTPGHVDFTYEVSRALAACEGAVLVVDATQGIQAQTLANLHLAQKQNLKIIPVLNKIDLPNAEPERVVGELVTILGFRKEEILKISAKTGEGVEEVLKEVIKKVPAPAGDSKAPSRALIFDSTYDKHRGVVAFVRVVDGALNSREKISLLGVGRETHALETGYFSPKFVKKDGLYAGEVGYIVTDFREVSLARVGDTITNEKINFFKQTGSLSQVGERKVVPLPGYREPKPMVYASFFPSESDDYPKLRDAIGKLKLSDSALFYEPVTVAAIGTGFRCGFLGLLHLDIVQERLSREYDLDLVVTSPTVEYKIKFKTGKEGIIHAASDMPDPSHIEEVSEPWAKLEIFTPANYLGGIIDLLTKRRGIQKNIEYASESRVLITFEVPLSNVIVDFYDKLKGLTSGYASLNYELVGFRPGDVVKMDILVADERIDAFSAIVHKSVATSEGREILTKLQDLIPRHQFSIALQVVIGGKIIARETIKAFRKDVTKGLYGGDDTRKKKVLQKQKKGKARLKKYGRVNIPQETFIEVFKR
ncbi:MAG: elongation factor 4 [Candidatus Doudnabacteria bacterium CG10_big_fil_rev_8_21_14_0_10_41_10]|uniref:Elongation factor 4 n=1 Tax=Candidatus Doudnabacteria bacterium CG10_big_fil_rev_8_21_14_0_10_41_10 TaxID=1974551 RepID=A0A2H0VFB6_9BACT|nr:MAG: elongation factor 4 [Candidatus Doudnabacteria bacterium CG10_big_fil_rev_8_21_14_0_10_41_10]